MRGPGSLRLYNYVQSVGADDETGQLPQKSDPPQDDKPVTLNNPSSWCKCLSSLCMGRKLTKDDWMHGAQTLYGFVVLIIGVYLLFALALSDKFVLNNQYSAKTLHIEKQKKKQNDGGSADRSVANTLVKDNIVKKT
jgi:hypothetical protein